MKKLRSVLAAAWRDSRTAVYAFLFSFATGAYSFIHAHGVPKSHADWTVLLWSLGGIAFSALVRAVDSYIGRVAAAAVKVAFAGGVVVNKQDIQAMVQAGIEAAEKRIAAEAAQAAAATDAAPTAAPPAPPAS